MRFIYTILFYLFILFYDTFSSMILLSYEFIIFSHIPLMANLILIFIFFIKAVPRFYKHILRLEPNVQNLNKPLNY